MKVLYKDNPRVIVIYSETHSLTLQYLNRKNTENTVAVEVLPNDNVTRETGFRPLIKRPVFGCLGLINVDKQVFMAVITGSTKNVASPVSYEQVDKINAVEFILLTSDEWDFVDLDTNGLPIIGETGEEADEYPRAVHPCHDLKKLLSNGSFYFSNNFDLTSLAQNRGVSHKMFSEKPHVHFGKHYQQDYMWNSFLMQELFSFRSNLESYAQSILDSNNFLTIAIRGFAKTVPLSGAGDSISIISKQSWRRAGTRFNARGIDDNGFVANFVETEFIYTNPSKNSIFAFTQIRGSVPTFWEQDSTLINPKITLTRSLDATQPVFNKHFGDICQKYGVSHVVNLLSKTKPAEAAILRRYRELFQKCDLQDEISFTEFDFHQETKLSVGFSGATKIIPLLHDSLEQFGWFYYDLESDEVITRQDGIFRTNCLDCLDRTNLIQQVLCQYVLENILKNQQPGNRLSVEEMSLRHNTLWADNGDAISQIYTGTNALKSSFSRSGKMNLAGALSDVTKSVSRMYQNTFVDGKKQSTMDLLVGYDSRNSVPVKIYDPINEYVSNKLKLNSHLFTTKKNISIFVGTFNVNAFDIMTKGVDLTQWLFPAQNSGFSSPDVYAIGLQEIIELNAGSILSADALRALKWSEVITDQLNSNRDQYLLLRTESIASMTLLLFVKKTQVAQVTQVSGSSKKTGLGGIAANKGACSVRFDFGLTSFAMITSHLAAGSNAVVERFNDYQTIMHGLTFTRNIGLTDHDHILWFGDLNYRIDLPNNACRELVENGAFDELIAVDQLNHEFVQKGAFHGFKEGVVKFYPTYKFDKGTSNYDTSEKQRVPSWTDRVLYKTAKGVESMKQLNYSSLMEIYASDHKPVFSTFESKVEFIDEDKKSKLAKLLYESYKLEVSGNDTLVDTSSTFSKSSASTQHTSFSTDTLSEMNLLDHDFDSPAPKLPSRSNDSTLPKRIPPPPASRRVGNAELEILKPTRKTPDHANPPTPPPRKGANLVASSSTPNLVPVKPPIGFSIAPLIPSRSNTATPTNSLISSQVNSRVSSPAQPVLAKPYASTGSIKPFVAAKVQDSGPGRNGGIAKSATSGPIKPLVPVKPSALSGHKTKEEAPIVAPPVTNSNGTVAPPPPAPRSMSDWTPLVPK